MAGIRVEHVFLPRMELPTADWGDSYTIICADRRLSARGAAERLLAKPPGWVRLLLSIRNRLMNLAGLTAAEETERPERNRIGAFPVVCEDPKRIVLGFDDLHLDFRIVVDVDAVEEGKRVALTTLVARHNLFGRAYLTAVMPFHRLIARRVMRNLTVGQSVSR